MATEIKLPDQLEGVDGITVTRWRVKEGDSVQVGDILLEVATDKVDTEVPSPVAGSILQINYRDGETMPADPTLAIVGAVGETVASPAAAPAPTPVPAPTPTPAAAAAEAGEKSKATPVARRIAEERGIDLEAVKGSGLRAGDEGGCPGLQRASAPPAAESAVLRDPDLADVPNLTVTRLAVENSIDLRTLAGDRPLAAVTKDEVLSAIASRAAGHTVTVPPRLAPAVGAHRPPNTTSCTGRSRRGVGCTGHPRTPPAVAAGEDFIPHSRMRQLIARNTMQSAFGIPHVTTMWDVNMAAVLAHRKAHRAEFARGGVNLTVTAYLVQAIVAGLQATPAANARWTDEGVVLKRYYHIGVAVALPPDKNGIGGLIVPVIKHASDLNLMGIARTVNDLAERARARSAQTGRLQEGTFTLTNYGTSGSRFQTPVIHDGQAGILGVGAIEKRAVVVSQGSPLEANTGDYLAFLPMTTLGFSYDHRILDGATADAFCAAVKNTLENWS
ncbi:MAG: 2-oxo acid dehydrogenase subunit E2 [Anaerolineae bacterium]|nr:MAG: 2-oxo acid dehydrogenase subunit E2 [Anaerolineae bacterium]